MLPVQRETSQNGNRRNQPQQRAVHQAMEPPRRGERRAMRPEDSDP